MVIPKSLSFKVIIFVKKQKLFFPPVWKFLLIDLVGNAPLVITYNKIVKPQETQRKKFPI